MAFIGDESFSRKISGTKNGLHPDFQTTNVVALQQLQYKFIVECIVSKFWS